MADTTDGSGSTSDGSSTSGGDGGIINFLTQPLGMALVGGFVAAIAAGYFII